MLFDGNEQNLARPAQAKDSVIDYEIGFLFNFAASKSTRFDLEPVLIYNKKDGKTEYKRISLNSEKGRTLLRPLADSLYHDFLEFSNEKLMRWMNRTGNRFIISSANGSWSHVSAKELINLRKRYIELLQKLAPELSRWPNIFILKTGKFNSLSQQPVKVSDQPFRLMIKADVTGKHLGIKLLLSTDQGEMPMNLLGGFLQEFNNTLYLPPDSSAMALMDIFKQGPLNFPLSERKEVIGKYLIPWSTICQVDIHDKLQVEFASYDPQCGVRLSELNESNLMMRPVFLYDEEEMEYEENLHHVTESEDKIRVIHRNKPVEKNLLEYLRSLHPSFARQRNNPFFYLHFDEVMKKEWFLKMLRAVQEKDYAVYGLADLKKFRYSSHTPRFIISAKSSIDWFDLKITIQWGDQKVSLKEIRHAILNGQDTIMLKDGTLGHIPEEWVSQYAVMLRTGVEEKGTLRVNKIHFALLEDIIDKFDSLGQKEIEERKRKLFHYDTVEKAPLSHAVTATLRPYQQSGFHWLQALDELGWGGCLADDMGLGKTLQTISFLQFLKEKYPNSTQLVICPTSLIFNWENEIKKFCPTLRFYTYYGTQREFKKTHFEEYDVVLTSYGTARNDQEVLSDFLWQYIILDESQSIKNPDAQVTKAIKKIRSVNRLIISGTPVQNNTFDLFAQFNFLNPGLLGSREFFNREFAVPIDKLGNTEKTKYLRKLIYPFTLRRTKEQVASDLPDKTVSILWCAMNDAQRKLYDEYRNGYRNKLLKRIDEEGMAKSGMAVLEGLLRLRQICDHPTLVTKEDDAIKTSSVKIEELVREVQENSGYNKVLIFSQFTEMLQLIKTEFEDAGISYCYLDGRTSLNERKEQVEKFHEDEGIKTFLISLKAGGVGLNLTVADYVFLVDPWWNPAVEEQAIDRTHRIGQTRKVFAYKMICKDSVEEKILQLQERKKMLAEDLIKEDTAFVKNLNREDVEFLFS